uniref:C2H2-type domain-containing protein n=1 Tax=Angiostrongylus cantonensis TaxID=6313 RepID=A0A158P9A2_ANGCA
MGKTRASMSSSSGVKKESIKDFNSALPANFQERLIRGALQANGGTLPCFKCNKSFTTTFSLIAHIRRCRKPIAVGVNLPNFSLAKTLKTPRSTSLAKKHLNACSPISSFEELKNCPTFTDYKKAIAHLDSCIRPMYFAYLEGRADEFRLLDKKTKARYVREGMATNLQLPCLECGRSFTHQYGLIYHIERCNVDDELAKDFSAEEALHAILGPYRSISSPKRRRTFGGCKVSVSAGVIPENSTRASITGDGKLRFKFRKADIKDGFDGLAGYPRYLGQVRKSLEQWKNEVSELSYCSRLLEIQPSVWSSYSDSSVLPFTLKESVGFRIFESKKQDNEKSVPTSCRRLQALNTVELENGDEYVTIAYCGGPINAIRVAPNSMSSDEEVVAVVTYTSKLRMWFILKSNYGLIFDVQWLDRPRSSSEKSLIGFIALSTAQGVILIYRLDTTSVPSPSLHSQNFPIVEPNPAIILEQEKFFDKPSDANSYSFPPPIHTMAWSARANAQHIVGVNAAGAAVIWDLQRSSDAPHVLLDPAWSSPATSAAFINTFEGNGRLFLKVYIALSFRERMVRVYNIRTYECSLEENTVRTAGHINFFLSQCLIFLILSTSLLKMKLVSFVLFYLRSRVSSQPRLLPGFFAFQAEYFSSGTVPSNGVCFICTEAKSDGYFVLPLANKHELMTWDVTTSPTNAVVASCGVDGRLLLSANGRLATFGSSMDFAFSVLKSALAITRRRISDPESQRLGNLKNNSEAAEGKEPHPQACPSYTTHEDTLQHLWLDISLKPETQTRRTRLDYSALDLRVESLNCVATNNLLRSFVFTGGQAGLMFIRPCVVDDSQTAVGFEELFTAKPEPL